MGFLLILHGQLVKPDKMCLKTLTSAWSVSFSLSLCGLTLLGTSNSSEHVSVAISTGPAARGWENFSAGGIPGNEQNWDRNTMNIFLITLEKQREMSPWNAARVIVQTGTNQMGEENVGSLEGAELKHY